MNQGGVKHAAAEHTRLENKRERRRGAAGRAAALRRAPSDSDCSGETASLSADSGDRAVRPAPPPTRSGKSRSRRRGSEWEVLEGLKDGQRFEKRPDVFNGYLHKKRKWPLKGWHKRFFVVDGGILVYARSPTDVARGRLHGSVDVGLSVISAKARRRRIDIDADEFIYHLRAKTPEVFRTWLNVLKAHRLYRQHLLTFGARESVPKIHAPLDDLPPTDTSSRTSSSIEPSSFSSIEDYPSNPKLPRDSQLHLPCHVDSPGNGDTNQNPLNDWQGTNTDTSELSPLNTQVLNANKYDDINNKSLCSMNCVARRLMDKLKRKKSPDLSMASTDAEKQIVTTDLDLNSIQSTNFKSSLIDSININPTTRNVFPTNDINVKSKKGKEKEILFHENKAEPTTAFYFFTRKKYAADKSQMRRSNKSTNLVKYRNVMDEPTLKKPLSRCLLLGKSEVKKRVREETEKIKYETTACNIVSKHSICTQVENENISVHHVLSDAAYDKMTERLIVSLFENCSTYDRDDIKTYINEVIKELYDFKLRDNPHPVKKLFRCLLEYCFRNTSVVFLKEALTATKSINRQSNGFFMKDEILSNVCLHRTNKATQFYGLSDIAAFKVTKNVNRHISRANKTEKKCAPKCNSHIRDTENFEKERKIQELERLMKNTVYICDTTGSTGCKARDIKITQTLIDNIGIASRSYVINKSSENPGDDKSSSSTEIPKIQDTINHLISDTSIPPDMAKDILSVYLDVLRDDKSLKTSSLESSDNSVKDKNSDEQPTCDVNAEAIVTRVSKSVTTLEIIDNNKNEDKSAKNDKIQPVDPGQLYLKEILDKITTIFSKVTKANGNNVHNISKDKVSESKVNMKKGELSRPVKEFSEKRDKNSVVIDLSKYNVEHVYMSSDPIVKGIKSITIKLKEKPPNTVEPEKTLVKGIESDHWISYVNPSDTTSNNVFNNRTINNPYVALNPFAKKLIELSGSDATSKAYRAIHESSNSIQDDLNLNKSFETNDETQSCFVMSIKKGNLPSSFQTKKKVRLKECKSIVINSKPNSPEVSNPELNVFERPVPKLIDENFILLLLENVTLLSKNIPSLYKDLNSLYIKLRKKHDKSIKNISNSQGLSLLGKIYNEETPKTTEGNEIPIRINTENIDTKENKSVQTLKEFNHISTMVSKTNLPIEEYFVEKAISAYQCNDYVHIDVHKETKNRFIKLDYNKSSPYKGRYLTDLTRTPSFNSMTNEIQLREQTTSNPNWLRINTRECAISTIIKCVLETGSTQNFKFQQPSHSRNFGRESLSTKIEDSHNLKQELRKEISLISPMLKVSTQSQTDKNMIMFLKESNKGRDCNVYQLFLSKNYEPTKSSSVTVFNEDGKKSDDMKTLYRCTSDPSFRSGLISPTSPPLRGPQAGFVSGTPGGRLAGWIIESGGPLENASRELGQAQLSVQQLQRLLDALDMQLQVHHDTDVSLEGASPSVKKDRRKFGLRKKKSNSKCASVELAQHQLPHLDPSGSHMALSALTAPPSPGGGASSAPNSAASLPIACAAARPQSLPGAESLGATGPASLTSLTPDHQLREDFTVLAKDLVASLKTIVSTLVCERGRLRAAMEAAEGASTPGGPIMAALRTNLNSALQQNSELRSRLSRIHDASDLADISSVGPNSDQQVNRQFQQSLSYSSSCVSASEFFDAEEHEDDDDKDAEIIAADETGVIELDGDSSSEAGSLSSEEGSASSDNSDGAMLSAEQVTLRLNNGSESRPTSCWQRRTRLPSPRPNPGGPSLWNLLYKNIGKDLSQISMPVTINEPLNMLQRLCEELEYSELLEAAAMSTNALERMSLIAAFAVSAYAASAHRAASKPFNPLLHETYECLRDDRAFRFLAEQVSHHPPISACHAESPRWCFWQEARIKTKFWGKSMEFQPTGRVHVRLITTGDHYSWNKVTTCVHNLFGGQRWVDQYGEMHIVCHGTDITAKLNFVKASSWSGSRHEVRGAVSSTRAGSRLRLAGRWSEALYVGDPPAARLLWRPGAMPPDHEMYYGFTRFAMELNEIEPGTRELLPHTDTRLRPDQRALEEGDVEAAERHKLQLEQSQRDRRRDEPSHTPAWFRKIVEDGEEMWVFSGEYWKAREAGFGEVAPRIW